MDKLAGRLLSWVAIEDQPHRGSKIRAAWIVASLHAAIRLTLALWFARSPRYLLALPVALFALGMWRRFMRPIAVVLTLVQFVRFSMSYPDVSNHYLIECVSLLIFAVVDLDREEERQLCLSMLCWLVVVVLFMSGLQKLLHGCYFKGQYLAYMVSTTDRFHRFFSPILSSADLAHLESLKRGPPSGPYRVQSMIFVLVSNAVWLGEMGTAVGLLWQRVRPLALIGAVALMAGILASSNELFFDTLFLNLLLLFARSNLIVKALPLSLLAYAYYLAVGLGIIPGGFVW